MTKTCHRCKAEKPLSEFGKNAARRDGHQSACRVCVKHYNRQYYLRSPQRNADRSAWIESAREEGFRYIFEYLRAHPCVDCGNGDLRVLDFDHVTGTKEFCVTDAVRAGTPLDEIIAEIAKCEVRCANCHRIVTAVRANSRRQREHLLAPVA